jgi:hypothetical protein
MAKLSNFAERRLTGLSPTLQKEKESPEVISVIWSGDTEH